MSAMNNGLLYLLRDRKKNEVMVSSFGNLQEPHVFGEALST